MSANPQEIPGSLFSLDDAMLARILEHARPLGHHEDRGRLNLGFGFLYYGLARTVRPAHVVAIGSGFGFSVVCLALALKDNGLGALSFVDPSCSMLHDEPLKTVGGATHWGEAEHVRAHFDRFGVADVVTHFKATSGEFFGRYEDLSLGVIDVAFIDGNHSFWQVRQDFIDVMRHARRNSYVFLHDTNLVVREMIGHSGVRRWVSILRRDTDFFEIIDFPFSSGVALVRVLRDGPWHPGV